MQVFKDDLLHPPSVLILTRQFNNESCAFAITFGLGTDGAAVGDDDVLSDVEAVTGGVCVYPL